MNQQEPFTRRHLFAAARAEADAAAHGVRLRLNLAAPLPYAPDPRNRWHLRDNPAHATCPGCGEPFGKEQPRCMTAAGREAHSRTLRDGWADAVAAHLAAAQFPARLKDKTFENFEGRKGASDARRACERYAGEFEIGKMSEGLYLVGTFGSGKSHLAKAIGDRIVRRTLANVLYITALDLVQAVQDGFAQGGSTIVRDALAAELLILDDLGQDTAPTDFARKTIFTVVDGRYQANLPTIVTANVGDAVLEKQFGGALVSRLYECTALVRVSAADHRREKAKRAA